MMNNHLELGQLGVVRWSGALSGKGPSENDWTTYAASTMVLSSLPWGVWGNYFPHGLFLVISGMRQFDGMYPEWRLM